MGPREIIRLAGVAVAALALFVFVWQTTHVSAPAVQTTSFPPWQLTAEQVLVPLA